MTSQSNKRAPLARYGTAEFTRHVSELYRQGDDELAEKAERYGRVPVMKPAPSLGELTASILRKARGAR